MIKRIFAAAACTALLLSAFTPAYAGGLVDRVTALPGVPGSTMTNPGAADDDEDATPYDTLIEKYAKLNGVDSDLAHAIIEVESNYNPRTRGLAGEIGLMQIKPATARMMGYQGSAKGLYDPETNLRYGMKYLAIAQQLGGGTTCSTVLKYNAGHGAKRMNPVSKRYCGKVTMILAEG